MNNGKEHWLFRPVLGRWATIFGITWLETAIVLAILAVVVGAALGGLWFGGR